MMMKGACSGCAGSTAHSKKELNPNNETLYSEVKSVEGEDDPNSTTKPILRI